jgi:hypothetical protein
LVNILQRIFRLDLDITELETPPNAPAGKDARAPVELREPQSIGEAQPDQAQTHAQMIAREDLGPKSSFISWRGDVALCIGTIQKYSNCVLNHGRIESWQQYNYTEEDTQRIAPLLQDLLALGRPRAAIHVAQVSIGSHLSGLH